MSSRTPVLTAALCAALTIAIAAPAAADSLVFIKAGNVWLSNPDGTNQHQVTRDGSADSAYRSPSQADDGTIVAARHDEIVRMRQDGTVLNRIDPPGSQGTIFLDGPPIETAISPDAKLVAYSYAQAACPPAAPCGVRRSTQYTYADRFTPAAEFGSQRGVLGASWISNSRTLLFGATGSQVNIDDVGGGDDSFAHWFDDAEGDDIGDAELARQGDRLALVHGNGEDRRIAVYRVSAPAGASAPQAVCETAPAPEHGEPSWSPSGGALAYSGPNGIMVSTLPNFASGTPCAGSTDTLVIADGSEPDWGPADVDPRPAVAPPPPAPRPAPSPAPAPAPQKRDAAKPMAKCKKVRGKKTRLRCERRARRTAALRRCERKPVKTRARCVRNVKRRYR